MKMIAVPSAKICFCIYYFSLVLSTASFSQTSVRLEFASVSPSNVASLRANDAAGTGNHIAGENKESVSASLKEFKGWKDKQGSIQLSWQMLNNKGEGFFEIQRSLSGGSYIKIGAMLSSQENKYQFTDKSIVQPAYYYRLKIINTEGSISYSDPILIEIKKLSTPISKKTITATAKKEAVASAKTAIKRTTDRKVISLKSSKQFSSSLLYFTNQLIFNLELNKKGPVYIHLSTLQGRISLQREYAGQKGNNELVLDHLNLLPEGNYTLIVKCNGQKFNLMAKK